MRMSCAAWWLWLIILYLKVAKSVDLKSAHHKKKDFCNFMYGDGC